MNHKKEQQLMAEAYEQIQEGLFDRLKARGSQAIGSIKGAGQQLAGKAQQVAGQAVGGAGNLVSRGVQAVGGTMDPSKNKLLQAGNSLQNAGLKQQRAGARVGDESKYKSYITNSAKTIAVDLQKLGMPIDDEASLIADIQNVVTNHLSQVTKSGQFRTSSGQIGGKVV